jgi:hypothetical protein
VVATRSYDGTVKVLVDDFLGYDPTGDYGLGEPTATDATVTVDVTGLPPGAYSVTSDRIGPVPPASVTPAAVPAHRGTSVSATVALPAEGVVMLTLTPAGRGRHHH